MFRDQWKPLVDDGIKPLVNGNEERPGSTFKCFCLEHLGLGDGNIYRWFLMWSLEISSSLAFLWMISKDSVGGKKRKIYQRWVECGWFHVVIQCYLFMLFNFFHMFWFSPDNYFRYAASNCCQATSDWRVIKNPETKERRNVSETPRNLNMNTMHWAEGILISTMLHYDTLTSFLTGFRRTSNFRRTEPQASSKQPKISRVH